MTRAKTQPFSSLSTIFSTFSHTSKEVCPTCMTMAASHAVTDFSEPEVPGEEIAVKQGRKRLRNPENWKVNHIKKKGLRKNAPRKDLSSLEACCKKGCIYEEFFD